MAFNINERMMAVDRAIITRNRKMSDLDRIDIYKFKPGMIHYVSEGQKLMLSTEPTKDEEGNDKFFTEILSDVTLNKRLLEYMPLTGGEQSPMSGQLVSTITNESPFKVNSNILVHNLNVELLDGSSASIQSNKNTIAKRDQYGNIYTASSLLFNGGRLMLEDDGIGVYSYNSSGDIELGKLYTKSISLGGSSFESAIITASTNESATTGTIEFSNEKWKLGLNGNTYRIVTVNDYGHGRGLDADTVDGKHVNDNIHDSNTLWTSEKVISEFAPNGYGLGQADAPMVPSDDLNSIWKSGTYAGKGSKNVPDNENGNYVINSSNSKGIYSEIAAFDSCNLYKRIKTNNQWSEWEKIITDKNIQNEGTCIIISDVTPSTDNENSFWYEVVN